MVTAEQEMTQRNHSANTKQALMQGIEPNLYGYKGFKKALKQTVSIGTDQAAQLQPTCSP